MNTNSWPGWVKRVLGDAATDPRTLKRNARRVRDGFVSKLRRVARRIPFAEDLLAAYYCALDPATPLKVRATLLAAIAYFVMPLDTLPDFLVLFGFTDDATVLLAALSLVSSHITAAHRDAARSALEGDLDGDLGGDLDIVDLTQDDFSEVSTRETRERGTDGDSPPA